MLAPGKDIPDFPALDIRIEVNRQRNYVLWSCRFGDGTKIQGYAHSRLSALQKVMAYVEGAAKAAATEEAGPRLVVVDNETAE